MHQPLDDAASRLLDALGGGVPLTLRLYADLATRAGTTEAATLATLRRLRAERIVLRVGGEFAPTALGYRPALGAVKVAEEAVERAVDILGALPNVTHVFELDDRYRLWYAIAAPSLARLEVAESGIASAIGAADRYRVLPDELYKATATFDADGAPEVSDDGLAATALSLDRDDRALVRLLQGDFPITERPFSALAITLSECGFDVDERWVLDRVKELAASGILRGIRATRRTREEPWRLALTLWVAVPACAPPGPVIAAFPEVLHCFERRVPGGVTAVVALVEGPSRADLDQTIARIGAITDLDPLRVVYPVREFKRSPMRYFAEGE